MTNLEAAKSIEGWAARRELNWKRNLEGALDEEKRWQLMGGGGTKENRYQMWTNWILVSPGFV